MNHLSSARVVIGTMRPPFLVLTIACVFLGTSTVDWSQTAVNMILLALTVIGALSAHVSVNMLNEYHDFNSGLDFNTERTPFSGGSGVLLNTPAAAHRVLIVGLMSLALTIVIGAYLLSLHGWGLLPLGIVGVALVLTYTGWINRHPMVCLLSPGVGFGVLMVVGTQYTLEGHYKALPWFVAIVPFLLVNNLLLLNQYPDIQADKLAGRHHLPIAYGVTCGTHVYALFAFGAAGCILLGVSLELLPRLSLLALSTLPLAVMAWLGARAHGEAIGHHPRYLAVNVVVAVATPALLGISLFFSGQP